MIEFSETHFLAHHTEGDVVEDFLDRLVADTPEWYVGACIHLPRWQVGTQANRFATIGPITDYTIGDPDTRKLHLPFGGRGRARHELEYLEESDPLANRQRFVKSVLLAQVSAGRDTLIAPWLIHSRKDLKNLRATIDFADRAKSHGLSENRQLLMGLEATQEIFAEKGTRDQMIDEIVESENGLPVYLRMTIDAPESRRPFGTEEPLVGLREVVTALEANGHPVLLPQSGLPGWLMLAFGSSGFGAGRSSSMERNTRPSTVGGGGGQPPLHWYFCPDLLGPVLAEELASLQQAGVGACDCPYCSDDPPQAGPGFDRNAAEKHYLWWCAFLAEEVRQAGDALGAVRTRVANAQGSWAQVREEGVPLDDRSQESHLGAWSAVVA